MLFGELRQGVSRIRKDGPKTVFPSYLKPNNMMTYCLLSVLLGQCVGCAKADEQQGTRTERSSVLAGALSVSGQKRSAHAAAVVAVAGFATAKETAAVRLAVIAEILC